MEQTEQKALGLFDDKLFTNGIVIRDEEFAEIQSDGKNNESIRIVNSGSLGFLGKLSRDIKRHAFYAEHSLRSTFNELSEKNKRCFKRHI